MKTRALLWIVLTMICVACDDSNDDVTSLKLSKDQITVSYGEMLGVLIENGIPPYSYVTADTTIARISIIKADSLHGLTQDAIYARGLKRGDTFVVLKDARGYTAKIDIHVITRYAYEVVEDTIFIIGQAEDADKIRSEFPSDGFPISTKGSYIFDFSSPQEGSLTLYSSVSGTPVKTEIRFSLDETTLTMINKDVSSVYEWKKYVFPSWLSPNEYQSKKDHNFRIIKDYTSQYAGQYDVTTVKRIQSIKRQHTL